MIRFICSDLDGTLLSRDTHTLPAVIFPLIHALREKGVFFAPASGRQLCNIRRLFAQADNMLYYICENGGLIARGSQVLGTVPFEKEMADEIIRDLQEAGTNLLLSSPTCAYVMRKNRAFADDMVYRLRNTVTVAECPQEIMEPLIKISGYRPDGVFGIAPALLKKWEGRVSAAQAGDDWFDFTVGNKGSGARMLCEQLGISLSEVAAFGDNFNDDPLLSIVGHPYVMEWAPPGMHKPGYLPCTSVVNTIRAILEEIS